MPYISATAEIMYAPLDRRLDTRFLRSAQHFACGSCPDHYAANGSICMRLELRSAAMVHRQLNHKGQAKPHRVASLRFNLQFRSGGEQAGVTKKLLQSVGDQPG